MGANRWLLDPLAMIILVFPGIVLGLALLTMHLALPIAVDGTNWSRVSAFTVRYLPQGMRFSYTGLIGIHGEREQSAEVCGTTWGQAIRIIVIPLIMLALFADWIHVFLITICEFSITALFNGPGSQVISCPFPSSGKTGAWASSLPSVWSLPPASSYWPLCFDGCPGFTAREFESRRKSNANGTSIKPVV